MARPSATVSAIEAKAYTIEPATAIRNGRRMRPDVRDDQAQAAQEQAALGISGVAT